MDARLLKVAVQGPPVRPAPYVCMSWSTENTRLAQLIIGKPRGNTQCNVSEMYLDQLIIASLEEALWSDENIIVKNWGLHEGLSSVWTLIATEQLWFCKTVYRIPHRIANQLRKIHCLCNTCCHFQSLPFVKFKGSFSWNECSLRCEAVWSSLPPSCSGKKNTLRRAGAKNGRGISVTGRGGP
jgi:hypothetical protein